MRTEQQNREEERRTKRAEDRRTTIEKQSIREHCRAEREGLTEQNRT